MENQINNTSVEEVQTETTEVEVKTEKTYTEEEFQTKVNEILNKKFSQWKKKEEEAKEEAAKLAKMDAEEKAKYEFEQKVKEFEETKKAFENEKLLNETSKQLASKNLPIEFAEMLKGADAEKTFENIKIFEEKFNAALEVKVNERLKGNIPKTGTVASGTVNPYDKKTWSLTKQMELEMNNPTLAEQLRKSAK